jgi:hypothetical protein
MQCNMVVVMMMIYIHDTELASLKLFFSYLSTEVSRNQTTSFKITRWSSTEHFAI